MNNEIHGNGSQNGRPKFKEGIQHGHSNKRDGHNLPNGRKFVGEFKKIMGTMSSPNGALPK